MTQPRKAYKTDLTDQQWQLLSPVLDELCPEINHGQKRKVSLREVLNTIFYQARTGCQWDLLPHDLVPKSTAFDYFTNWRDNGTLNAIHQTLLTGIRTTSCNAAGELRDEHPSAGSIDSQSVKGTQACEDRGYDAGKKIKGIKRHIAVDTLGLLLAVTVTIASVQDADGAVGLIGQLTSERQPNLEVIWVDGAYHRYALYKTIDTDKRITWSLEVIKRSDDQKGFVVLPKRWVVERTFAWLDRWRRMSKAYERTQASSEAWVKIASVGRMLRYLSPPGNEPAFKYRRSVAQTPASGLAA